MIDGPIFYLFGLCHYIRAMYRTYFSLLMFLTFGSGCTADSSFSPITEAYGSKISFKNDRVLKFPDLVLTFKGNHKADVRTPDGRPIPFGPYYDFEIATQGSSKTVSWSSGTGAIGPRSFRAAGKCFSLELRYADNIGKLDDDELVLSVSPDTWCGNVK